MFAPYLGDRLSSTASPILVLHINVLFDLRCSDALLHCEVLVSGALPVLMTHAGRFSAQRTPVQVRWRLRALRSCLHMDENLIRCEFEPLSFSLIWVCGADEGKD